MDRGFVAVKLRDESGVRMKFLNDPFSNGVVLTSDSPDRNYFLWSIGAQALIARGVSGFVNFETVSGLSRTDYYTVTLGARMEF